jgi:transcriptional regulator
VPKTDLLQGTLDLLLLKILTLGPNHGWGIANRIRQISREGLEASQGSLYPALHRLELRGDVESEMTASENNRRARVYKLTPAGRRRLADETASWEQFAALDQAHSAGRINTRDRAKAQEFWGCSHDSSHSLAASLGDAGSAPRWTTSCGFTWSKKSRHMLPAEYPRAKPGEWPCAILVA